jgi:hypothetical protein
MDRAWGMFYWVCIVWTVYAVGTIIIEVMG